MTVLQAEILISFWLHMTAIQVQIPNPCLDMTAIQVQILTPDAGNQFRLKQELTP